MKSNRPETETPIHRTTSGDAYTMESSQSAAPAEAPTASFVHHNGDNESIARLLADLLSRMRDDPALRPPPLGPKALLAIAQYQITSAAVNPSASPIFTDPSIERSRS